MVDSWEIAILQSIKMLGGEARLQQIYKTVSQFKNLTEDHLRETEWGRREAYQHIIRSYVSNLNKSGELTRITTGKYRLTKKGDQRLTEDKSGRMRPKIPPKLDPTDPEETIRVLREQYYILRDPALVKKIKMKYQYKCQICGVTIRLPGGKLYAEAHHLQPLGSPHDGPDVLPNMLCVCPNHHVQLDFGVIKLRRSDFKFVRHHIGNKYLSYHNTKYATSIKNKSRSFRTT